MPSGSGYVLAYDAWNPRVETDGAYNKILRFEKGDTLDGVELTDKQVEDMTAGWRPMIVKKDSKAHKVLMGVNPDEEEEKEEEKTPQSQPQRQPEKR
jgi:hypothetical protein